MNLPSFEQFEPTVKAGGIIIADSSLIEAKSTRTDIDVYYIPATALASDMGKQSLANMIILGKLLAVMGDFNEDEIKTVLSKVIPPKKADMLEINMKAMQIGSEN
jgi:2-oxoglutarate ferredoxin oxidoreductase subunit gamma